jgi:hypothetical protein
MGGSTSKSLRAAKGHQNQPNKAPLKNKTPSRLKMTPENRKPTGTTADNDTNKFKLKTQS